MHAASLLCARCLHRLRAQEGSISVLWPCLHCLTILHYHARHICGMQVGCKQLQRWAQTHMHACMRAPVHSTVTTAHARAFSQDRVESASKDLMKAEGELRAAVDVAAMRAAGSEYTRESRGTQAGTCASMCVCACVSACARPCLHAGAGVWVWVMGGVGGWLRRI